MVVSVTASTASGSPLSKTDLGRVQTDSSFLGQQRRNVLCNFLGSWSVIHD